MLRRWIGNWAMRRQIAEAAKMLAHIDANDLDFAAFQLAISTDRRHVLERINGWNLLKPTEVMRDDPLASFKTVEAIKSLQRKGELSAAAAVMLWAHTLRAAAADASPELQVIVREIWRRLHAADDRVDEARINFHLLTRTPLLDTSGYEQTPEF